MTHLKRFLTILFLGMASIKSVEGQKTEKITFPSQILKEERTIRVHLPASFEDSTNKSYPLIICLDGEYMFYATLGAAEPLSLRKLIPESIIIGIDQNYSVDGKYFARWHDCDYAPSKGELKDKGVLFREFILKEIIPLAENKYRAGKFKSIFGHSLTGNYVNFFLIDPTSPFSGIVSISPFVPETIQNKIKQGIIDSKSEKYFFLATGEVDLSIHRAQALLMDSTLFGPGKNERFHYQFADYTNETHMSLPVRSMSDALSHIFSGYSPLYYLENDSVLLLEDNLITYLEKRYSGIKNTYGITLPYREDDLLAISWIAEEKENWDELQIIANLTKEQFPESVYGYYMEGTALEKKGDLKAALIAYKTGYSKLNEDTGNKEDFYKEIERIEDLLNKKK